MSKTHNVTRLMHLAYQGDREAKEEFFARIGERLDRIVREARRRYPGARRDADTKDDLHDVWLRMLEAAGVTRKRYANREQFSAACYTCAKNLLIDRLKRKEKRVAGDEVRECQRDARHHRGKSSPSHRADHRIQVEEIAEAVMALHSRGELSDRDLALYGHLTISCLSPAEAFRSLDIKESTGRDMLKRIRARIVCFLHGDRE